LFADLVGILFQAKASKAIASTGTIIHFKPWGTAQTSARLMTLGRCPVDEFFVQPMTTIVTPPNLSAHKPTGDCASRYDDTAQMPGRCP
jgi:hypothetical protein